VEAVVKGEATRMIHDHIKSNGGTPAHGGTTAAQDALGKQQAQQAEADARRAKDKAWHEEDKAHDAKREARKAEKAAERAKKPRNSPAPPPAPPEAAGTPPPPPPKQKPASPKQKRKAYEAGVKDGRAWMNAWKTHPSSELSLEDAIAAAKHEAPHTVVQVPRGSPEEQAKLETARRVKSAQNAAKDTEARNIEEDKENAAVKAAAQKAAAGKSEELSTDMAFLEEEEGKSQSRRSAFMPDEDMMDFERDFDLEFDVKSHQFPVQQEADEEADNTEEWADHLQL
jgi:hypothetical protein